MDIPIAEGVTVEKAVEIAKELFEKKIERFDELIALSLSQDNLDDFINGYRELREAGFEFDDAVETAASQLDLENEEESKDE